MAALLTLTTVTATGCASDRAPDPVPGTAGAPSTPSLKAAPPVPAATPSPAGPQASTPAGSSKVRYAPDFCKENPIDGDTHQVLQVNGGEQLPNGLRTVAARQTQLKCGPGVDNGGYFEMQEPLGPYYVAQNPTVRLLTNSEATQRPELKSADWHTLLKVLQGCEKAQAPAPYQCSPYFYVTIDNKNGGVITDFTAIFQS
ncbi:hypothetical protein [Streptomyces klenkii]|uniref:hypothetical protein n=1 Tax=Streptomyces klenkii TaxID=1420899 RepID=UPI0034268526